MVIKEEVEAAAARVNDRRSGERRSAAGIEPTMEKQPLAFCSLRPFLALSERVDASVTSSTPARIEISH